ncbi:hypothetical protein PILCRDRAFT_12245 [Piloderma croceum F 1598]|uniref:BTB domain-containing protein n=1 Tax=Piloderma croceum (strain F 1598) TaxID=765440 RepID=A0A0C3FB10_PILCF|nr:hypothetical protein PILCRDRAFT_12245 [Piloderma croceum F 1598]
MAPLAKDHFPDVVWELIDDDDDNLNEPKEVWGHKAIIYARAPPSFQAHYFSFGPAPIGTLRPRLCKRHPQRPVHPLPLPRPRLPRSLPFHLHVPCRFSFPSTNTTATSPGTILRLPTLFSNELEYLYTGKGFGAAFEFLFDTSESREEGDAEENRIEKLRKDLVFIWRSRLYSVIRIALTGNFSLANHESATAIFSSHQFILVSCSPYFYSQLITYPSKPTFDGPLTLTLPSPPFTPASLHFTLGYIYTGTLVFSHRGYDLNAAFHIMRSSIYLALNALYNEI